MKRVLACVLSSIVVGPAMAQVTNYTNFTNWTEATDYYQAITFSSLSGGTVVTSQYAGVGVTFQNALTIPAANFTDGIGITNTDQMNPIEVDFAGNTTAFGVDFLDYAQIQLYEGNALVGTSNAFTNGGLSTTFAGITSSTAFDRVLIDPFGPGPVLVDNIYWGKVAAVPEPATMAVLAASLAGLAARRRRR